MGSYLKLYAKVKNGDYVELTSFNCASSEFYQELNDNIMISSSYKYVNDSIVESKEYTHIDLSAILDCLEDIEKRINTAKHEISVSYRILTGEEKVFDIIRAEDYLEELLILKGQFTFLKSFIEGSEYSDIEGLYCNV